MTTRQPCPPAPGPLEAARAHIKRLLSAAAIGAVIDEATITAAYR